MPRAFPGMDPYLESPEFWPDFHSTFVNCWREAIATFLPENYEARIDERVSLIEMPATDERQTALGRHILPDVSVTRVTDSAHENSQEGSVLTREPVVVPLIMAPEEVRETYIRILHRPDRSLVAVLELLSPTNKTDIGFGDYVQKRMALLRQPVHLVELDLLVGGQRVPTARPLPTGHYFALVARSERRPFADVYAWSIRDRLPKIPIPLKAPDADVVVDLGDVFTTAFERGRYARSLRYDAPPAITLPESELRWCREQAQRATR